MAEKTGRKGRSDKGKWRSNPEVVVAERKDGKRPDIEEVPPLYSTYDAPRPANAIFDDQAADHVVAWIESNIRHYKAEWAGQPFLLADWQKRLLRHIFGWKIPDEHGELVRLHNKVYVECPRKAGKTTLAAAVAVYLAFADGENAPQIIFAAKNEKQAGICYGAAAEAIHATTGTDNDLYALAHPRKSPKEYELRENLGGFLRPVANDAEAAQGLEPHGLIFDELAMQKNRRELWTALIEGSNSRRQPMLFGITTAGYERVSIAFELHEHTRRIQEGTISDSSFCGVVYGAPMDADWTDPEVWRRANPSMGATVKLRRYQEGYESVKNIPAAQNEWRIFQLSQWVGQESRYLDMEAWTAVDAKRDEREPAGKRPAWGGLDLSATQDISCFSVVAERKDGGLDLFTYPFLPDAELRARQKRDGANYELWRDQGFLTLTEGQVIRKDAIKKAMLEAAEQFDLRDITYDKHLADLIVQEMTDLGFTMLKLDQGYGGMDPGTVLLKDLVAEGKLHHGGHPVLQWCADHFAVTMNAFGRVMPDKMKATQRIDPVVSGIMAIDGWQRRGKKKKRKSIFSNEYFAKESEKRPLAV